MGRSSQRKGADAERELAAKLREYGFEIERGGSLSYGELPDLSGIPGLHLEVKRCEALRLPEWLRQSEADAARFGDGAASVIFRRSREPWYICLSLDDFMRFYMRQKAEKSGKG